MSSILMHLGIEINGGVKRELGREGEGKFSFKGIQTSGASERTEGGWGDCVIFT